MKHNLTGMNTTKQTNMMAAMAMVAITSFVLSACGGSDDDDAPATLSKLGFD